MSEMREKLARDLIEIHAPAKPWTTKAVINLMMHSYAHGYVAGRESLMVEVMACVPCEKIGASGYETNYELLDAKADGEVGCAYL